MVLRDRLHQRQALLDHRGEVDRLQADLQLAGLDAGQVEHLVDQGHQVGAGTQHVPDVAALPLRQRRRVVGGEQLREAEDRVHRRAQLVAHAGEEIRLRAARAFGLVARACQLRGAFGHAGLEPGVGAAQVLLRPVPRRRVDVVDQQVRLASQRHAAGVGLGVHVPPVGRVELQWQLVDLAAASQLAQRLLADRGIGPEAQLQGGAAERLGTADAGQARPALVDVDDARVGVAHQADRHRRLGKDARQQFLVAAADLRVRRLVIAAPELHHRAAGRGLEREQREGTGQPRARRHEVARREGRAEAGGLGQRGRELGAGHAGEHLQRRPAEVGRLRDRDQFAGGRVGGHEKQLALLVERELQRTELRAAESDDGLQAALGIAQGRAQRLELGGVLQGVGPCSRRVVAGGRPGPDEAARARRGHCRGGPRQCGRG